MLFPTTGKEFLLLPSVLRQRRALQPQVSVDFDARFNVGVWLPITGGLTNLRKTQAGHSASPAPIRAVGGLRAAVYDGGTTYDITNWSGQPNKLTLVAVFRADAVPSNAQCAPVHRDGLSISWGHVNASYQGVVATNSSGSYPYVPLVNTSAGVWHTVVAKLDGAYLKVWQNGVYCGSVAASGAITAGTLYFGKTDVASFYFPGAIALVALADADVLTDEEAQDASANPWGLAEPTSSSLPLTYQKLKAPTASVIPARANRYGVLNPGRRSMLAEEFAVFIHSPSQTNLVTGHKLSYTGGVTYSGSLYGAVLQSNGWGTGDGAYAPARVIVGGTNNLTDFVVLAAYAGNGGLYPYLCGTLDTWSVGTGITCGHNGISGRWAAYDSGAPSWPTNLVDSGEILPTSYKPQILVHTRDGTTHKVFRDGILKGSKAGSNGSTTSEPFFQGNLSLQHTTFAAAVPILCSGRMLRCLSDAEVRDFSEQMLRLVSSQSKDIWLPWS